MSTFLIPSNRLFELGEPSLASRLETIRQYCKTLPFDHQSNWADVIFAGGLTPQALAQQFCEQRGELAPHQVLLMAFLQAMEVPQALFNGLPKRHRELFYRDHLRFHERPAQPDHVSVVFTPQPSVNELTLPAGLLLDAGTDTQGRPRRYQLEQPISINKGKLTDVRWVRQEDNLSHSRIDYDAKTQAQWPNGGLALFANNAENHVVSNARLIIDKRLSLDSGLRFVTLSFDYEVKSLYAHISVDGKWQEMQVEVRGKQVSLSITADAPPVSGAMGLDGIASDLPVLKLTPADRSRVPPVRSMSVGVKDSRAARVHTTDGWFSNSEACYPFGVQSEGQGRFTIVSEEWHALSGVTVALTPHWQTLPHKKMCVELTLANSSSIHELFRVSEAGIQENSIKFQLKDEDLTQRTVVLDFTLLQTGAARYELQEEDTPRVAATLHWQRLHINWRSDPFSVPEQYLQHPFGYGVRPWSLFERVQDAAQFGLEVEQLRQELVQGAAELKRLADEIKLELRRLEHLQNIMVVASESAPFLFDLIQQVVQQTSWATTIANHAFETAAQLMAAVLELHEAMWGARQLDILGQLESLAHALAQQGDDGHVQVVRLAQLLQELLQRVREMQKAVQRLEQLLPLFSLGQAVDTQMPIALFFQMLVINSGDDSIAQSALMALLQILDLGLEITLGEMYERGLLPSVFAQMLFEMTLQSQQGQEHQPTLHSVAEQLAEVPLNTLFRGLVSEITVAQLAELPFSRERHILLLAFFELIIADAEANIDPTPDRFQTLFATQLLNTPQEVEQIGQWFSSVPIEYALLLHWFLRKIGRTDIHTLYLGLIDLKAGQTTALGLSVKESLSQVVQWSYLASDGWRPLALKLDPTAQLVRSGLMSYTLPMDAATQTTLMPAGRHWLKARVATRADAQPTQLLGLETNCANALLVDASTVAADHFQTPLPIGTITHTVEVVPGLASVKQPWSSSGGRGPESGDAFYQRIAQQMNHRGRAVTWKDIENLLKELFPDVHSVKLPDPGAGGACPSRKVVVVPAHGHADNADQLRPEFSTQRLKEMSEHLQSLASPWLQVRLTNPNYRDVNVHYQVNFAPGFSAQQGYQLLHQALEQRYMPWLQSARAEVTLEQELSYYDMVDFIQGQDFVERVVNLTFDGRRESVSGAADTVLILQLSGERIQVASTQIPSEKMT